MDLLNRNNQEQPNESMKDSSFLSIPTSDTEEKHDREDPLAFERQSFDSLASLEDDQSLLNYSYSSDTLDDTNSCISDTDSFYSIHDPKSRSSSISISRRNCISPRSYTPHGSSTVYNFNGQYTCGESFS